MSPLLEKKYAMKNTNNKTYRLKEKLDEKRCIQLLANDGVTISEPMLERIVCFLDLLKTWNDFARLVSKTDINRLIERHLIDSLSLVPVILKMDHAEAIHLDIGSGGGFPAIPLKIVFPKLDVTLIERTERKVGFLRKAVGQLGLFGVRIVHGNFPDVLVSTHPDLITARAVEKPEKIFRQILNYLPGGSCFLCQRTEFPEVASDRFHVEPIHDTWSVSDLRRSKLYVIKKT